MKKPFKKIGLLLFLGMCGINTLFASENYSVDQVNQLIKENSSLKNLNENRTRMADAYIQLITENTPKNRKLAAKLIASIFNNEQVKKALKTTGGGALKTITLIFNQIKDNIETMDPKQKSAITEALNTDAANALAKRIISGAIEDKSGKIAKNIQKNFNEIRNEATLLQNDERFNASVDREIGEVITTEDFKNAGETLLKKGVLSRTKYLRLTLWHRWGVKKATAIIKMIGNALYNSINPSTNSNVDDTSTGSKGNTVIKQYNAAIKKAKASMTDPNVLEIIELQRKAQENNITLPPVEDMALSGKIFNQLIKEAFNPNSPNSDFAQQQLKEKAKDNIPLARNIQRLAMMDPNFDMNIMKEIDPSLAQKGPEGHRNASAGNTPSRPTGQEGDSGSTPVEQLNNYLERYETYSNDAKSRVRKLIAKMVEDKTLTLKDVNNALEEAKLGRDSKVYFLIKQEVQNLRQPNNTRTSPNNGPRQDPRQNPSRGNDRGEGEGGRGGYEPHER